MTVQSLQVQIPRGGPPLGQVCGKGALRYRLGRGPDRGLRQSLKAPSGAAERCTCWDGVLESPWGGAYVQGRPLKESSEVKAPQLPAALQPSTEPPGAHYKHFWAYPPLTHLWKRGFP